MIIQINNDSPIIYGDFNLKRELATVFNENDSKIVFKKARESFDDIIKQVLSSNIEKEDIDPIDLYLPFYQILTSPDGFILNVLSNFEIGTCLEISRNKKE